MDYSKGGGQRTASFRSLTGLLQSPHFLCSYVLITHWPRDRQPLLSSKEFRAHRDGSMGKAETSHISHTHTHPSPCSGETVTTPCQEKILSNLSGIRTHACRQTGMITADPQEQVCVCDMLKSAIMYE